MAGELIKRLKRIEEVVDPTKLAYQAHKYFKSITPFDTGNARRSTTLKGDEIHASYPYAQRLDNGWSKQAPKGMVDPTEKFIGDYIDKELGKK